MTARQTMFETPNAGLSMDEVDDIMAHLTASGFVVVPKEPDTAMKRALLVHRGYDPDAREDTLDRLGQMDLMTMGSFLRAYTAMVSAHGQKPDATK